MTKALIRVKRTYRPTSGDLIGFRLQACIPNKAARRMKKTASGFVATDEQAPSFTRTYLLGEASDCNMVVEADLERFKAKLAWSGFEEFELITNLDGKKIEPGEDYRRYEAKLVTMQELMEMGKQK